MIFQHMKSPNFHYHKDNFDVMKKKLKENSDETLSRMMESFMVCNNITPIIDEEERTLQAASPDEVALVKFAESKGDYFFLDRTTNFLKIRTPQGNEEEY